MSAYNLEPRATISKFDCICSKCGRKVKKGQEIWLDPRTKYVVCCDKPKE